MKNVCEINPYQRLDQEYDNKGEYETAVAAAQAILGICRRSCENCPIKGMVELNPKYIRLVTAENKQTDCFLV